MKLTVLVLTYNHERFIAQALESILAQRVNFDYEILVAEDNSTDGTRDIVFWISTADIRAELSRSSETGTWPQEEISGKHCRSAGESTWLC